MVPKLPPISSIKATPRRRWLIIFLANFWEIWTTVIQNDASRISLLTTLCFTLLGHWLFRDYIDSHSPLGFRKRCTLRTWKGQNRPATKIQHRTFVVRSTPISPSSPDFLALSAIRCSGASSCISCLIALLRGTAFLCDMGDRSKSVRWKHDLMVVD